MAIDDTGSILTISVLGVPLYSARGLTQTLDPIAAASVQERSINGTLTNLAPTGFQKYATKITCTDVNGPAIDGIWPGQTVTIECVRRLTYPLGGSPSRPVVSGSSVTEGNFVSYRPSLTMMIIAITTQEDEWNRSVQWEIDAEEV